ncbi:glycosyl hydrolases family 28-domain-containing protein [Xylogone sp. PMI_703]|nr:glycosyl hydrolases family 28-domain-containing protein [Xylogone sp. PMI_703]
MHMLSLFAIVLFSASLTEAHLRYRDSCSHNNCLRAFIRNGDEAIDFCQTYAPGNQIPSFAGNCNGDVAKVVSACSCIYTALPTSTTTTTSSIVTTISTTFSASTTTITAAPCLCTAWSQISAAQAACMSITLDNIHAPASSAIALTKLQTGASVIFSGNTTFGFTNSSQFRPIQISGNNITIRGTPGSIIDGGGPQYWDGLGSNGGLPKPGQFMKVSMTNNSIMKDLYIQNYPSHGINVAGVINSTIQNVILNNSLGDAPNDRSNGLSAAHNSDGFNVGNSINLLLQDCKVWNQDDCVVVSDSTNVTVRNVFCSGSHGLSIAGGGSGSGHNIANILFTNSTVTNSTNGLRIKTDFNATGSVVNVTFSNIAVSNIKEYGIDIQQDYENAGPTGDPSNGVLVKDISFSNVTGWVVPEALDYYILCGDGSCQNFTFDNVEITGGSEVSSCNYPAGGCPGP